MTEFVAFPKIPRLRRGCVVTEKIDGTNAQVHVRAIRYGELFNEAYDTRVDTESDAFYVRAGSRNRWIAPGNDNFGFATWVRANAIDLAKLGTGSHFGEWWGVGIQRGYGLHERRFSLFNTGRWQDDEQRPACCGVVPVLYQGVFDSVLIDGLILGLKTMGSVAAKGFDKPEGVIVWHEASRQMFKVLCEGDAMPKSALEAA